METWLLSLVSVVAVSLVSLIGLVAAGLDERRLRRLAMRLMSLAVGALLGDAFLHLLPEALVDGGRARAASLLALAGMLVFFVVEKLLRHRRDDRALPSLAAINVLGDGLHNLLDGMLIGASYLVGPTLGAATTAAVIAHEVPQELGDFGVLLHSGLSVRRAVALNLLSASAAIAGTVIVLVIGGTIAGTLVPIAAGGFVYIAAADLIPELHQDRTLRGLLEQAGLIAAGIAAMAALTLVG